MEDAHIAELDIGDGNALFGVFDGHGGPEVAKFVKNHFTKNLVSCPAYKRKDYKAALENTFLKMDRLLLTEKGKQELRTYMDTEAMDSLGYGDYLKQVESQAGCTATVVLITANEIYCANAGDSRTVMCERGVAVELSKDHKPDLPEERNRIMKAGGEVSEGRVNGMLALSRAIGDFDYKPLTPPKDAPHSWFLNNHMVTALPDVVVRPLHKDVEFVILACDGIWDCRTSDEVIQYYK
jgi:serine/threonine protein phosphatase PrpC